MSEREDDFKAVREYVEMGGCTDRECSNVSCRQPRDAAVALARIQAHVEALEGAIRVYTSDRHLCSRRPCSCGAYSSLAALAGETVP